jgi:hypothetical protein
MFCEYFLSTTTQLATIYVEKGGKGERETGMITRNGVTSCVARGYLCSSSLRRQKGTDKGSPPTHPYLIGTNFNSLARS